MASSSVVFYKIATTCLLILVGFIVRRMKIVPENSVAVFSKYIMYLALPVYFLYYVPACISPETVGDYWHYPFLGAGLFCLGDLFGLVTARLWARPGEHATFRMLVAFSNWIFMALAVCEPLFGQDGLRVVLLYNIGIIFYVWTFGMTGFRTAVGLGQQIKSLFVNVQTVALFLGLAVALLLPGVNGMDKLGSAELAALPWYLGLFTPVWETISLITSTALPLSIIQIGLLLGAPRVDTGRESVRSVWLVTGLRLVAVPVLVLGVQAVLFQFGILTVRAEFVSSVIIMAMPVAVLCLSVAEIHGGATRLAARCVLYTTVLGLLTAPFITWLAEYVYSIVNSTAI